jgi:hypothetical protein
MSFPPLNTIELLLKRTSQKMREAKIVPQMLHFKIYVIQKNNFVVCKDINNNYMYTSGQKR